MGRGETFYTYQGFERSISFGFKIVAFSKAELFPLYNKLNYLVSQVYPDYSANGVMRAPLVKLTIGDYIYRMPGFLGSVNLSIDVNAPWDLNEDSDTAQLPKIIDVDIEFKPIFNELPRRSITNERGLIRGSSIIGDSSFINVGQNVAFAVDSTETQSNNQTSNIDIPGKPPAIDNTQFVSQLINNIVPQNQQNVNVPFIGSIIPNK